MESLESLSEELEMEVKRGKGSEEARQKAEHKREGKLNRSEKLKGQRDKE